MKNNIDYPPLEVFCTTYFDELQNREKILCTDENLKHLKKEKTNGVYVLYNANDELIYAGESKNIFDRIYNHHRRGNGSELLNKIKEYNEFKSINEAKSYFSTCYIQYIEVKYGRSELEEYIIQIKDPPFNNYKKKQNKTSK